MQNLNKPWLSGFKTDIKSEKLYIAELFLLKSYNNSARKAQRDYVWWQWSVMQNLKENWLVAWKMT